MYGLGVAWPACTVLACTSLRTEAWGRAVAVQSPHRSLDQERLLRSELTGRLANSRMFKPNGGSRLVGLAVRVLAADLPRSAQLMEQFPDSGRRQAHTHHTSYHHDTSTRSPAFDSLPPARAPLRENLLLFLSLAPSVCVDLRSSCRGATSVVVRPSYAWAWLAPHQRHEFGRPIDRPCNSPSLGRYTEYPVFWASRVCMSLHCALSLASSQAQVFRYTMYVMTSLCGVCPNRRLPSAHLTVEVYYSGRLFSAQPHRS